MIESEYQNRLAVEVDFWTWILLSDIEWFDVTCIIKAKLLQSYSAVIENNVLCVYARITASECGLRLLYTYMNSLNINLQKFQKHVLIVIGLISA